MRSTDPNSGCSANNVSRNQSRQQTNEATAASAAERQDYVEVPSLLSLLAAARRIRSTDPNSGCSANNASRNQSQQQTNEAAAASASAAERRDFVEVPSLVSLLAATRSPASPRSIQRGHSSRLNLSPLPLSNDDIEWSHAALSNSRRSGVLLPSIAGALERALVFSAEVPEDDDGDNHGGVTMIDLPLPTENNNQSQSQQRRRRRRRRRRLSGGCHRHRPEGGRGGGEMDNNHRPEGGRGGGEMDNNDGGSALL